LKSARASLTECRSFLVNNDVPMTAATNGTPGKNIQVVGRLRHTVLSAFACCRVFPILLTATHLIHWESSFETSTHLIHWKPGFEASLFSPLPVRFHSNFCNPFRR
jgi:hypothetical protein